MLVCCLPGGLAAALMAKDMCWSPGQPQGLKEEFESSLIGMPAKGLTIWNSSHPTKSLAEGKAANPTREGFGLASLPQLVEGWELQCTVLLLPFTT